MASPGANKHPAVRRIKGAWSPQRDGDQKDVMMNKRCAGRNSQLSCTWMSTLCTAAKKHTVFTLALLSVKAMICIQLKIHQLNRQHTSFVHNRALISTKREEQWQCCFPLAVTQLNSKTSPVHTQNPLSASQEASLGFPIFCVPTHLLGRKARDTSSSPAVMKC